MKLSAEEILLIPHLQVRCPELLEGKTFTGVSTDSRTVAPGDLFVALRGENFDGHQFIKDVRAKGALGAIVDSTWAAHDQTRGAFLVVEDTTKAFGQLAYLYRKKFSIPVLAVAGSNGKTTTKDMVAAVLGMKYRVLCTQGNLNNHIGVPHTLLRLDESHGVAIVEIGTNHPGEIALLCRMLQPTHGLITTIGREHLEFFGTVEGVAKEEGVLFEHLGSTKEGFGFVNVNDPLVKQAAKPLKRKVNYGLLARGAGVRGRILGFNETCCAILQFQGRQMKNPLRVELAIPGEHNAQNALAAAAVGLAFKVPATKIRRALEAFRPASKRMEVKNVHGVMILNDSYNANPDSMMAALKTLAAATVSGKRIAVLGDMREVGPTGAAEHEAIGKEAARLGIDYVLTFGDLAKRISVGAGGPFALHYDQKNMLAEYLVELVAPGDAVLIKASRSMKLEDVATFLEERLQSPMQMYA
jgi:UDP-N-acetylmuramoyl-tripeptide--D-alanyl-D-alanine ligase